MSVRIRPKRPALLRFLAAGTCALTGLTVSTRAADPQSASAILQELNSFREMGSVLYIAAHPDDENTRLIAYLSCGRGYRTGYFSITRGDGGHNQIGPDLSQEHRGAITQEVLAARRIHGGKYLFTQPPS